jgi:hypothetical protein
MVFHLKQRAAAGIKFSIENELCSVLLLRSSAWEKLSLRGAKRTEMIDLIG